MGVLAEVTESENLTPLQLAVLAALDDEPGIDQRRLAVRLAIDPVSAGQLVDHLVEPRALTVVGRAGTRAP